MLWLAVDSVDLKLSLDVASNDNHLCRKPYPNLNTVKA